MSAQNRNGQIVTFYSYKGGVGRTMALANIAFLAAWNKRRVLIMDWDLEAPGVAYYFRGLLDKKTAKEIKQSEGVLDILWEWSMVTDNAMTTNSLKKSLRTFKDGSAFTNRVKKLLDSSLLDVDCTIDYIGAGAREVKTPELLTYEEALANFSWKDFYGEKAGGYLLEKWIEWAKHNYDLILIDSRTGLADVSGICTMQLPDKIALCYVLNRQNIDGVARVASSIRAKRQEQIELKAYAMRVSQRKTSEEDDARARATSELTRIGGFSTSFITDSLKNLSVQADDSVPFYETLSFFNTTDPETHPLSINYLRIAKDLLGPDLLMPKFDAEFISFIKRRLEPTQATVDYILELTSAQKDRAEQELENLVEKVIQSEADGDEIKLEYVQAIIEAIRLAIETENPISGYSLTGRILDLLRSLSGNSAEWLRLFASELIRHFETYTALFDEEESLALLDEIDAIHLQDRTHRGTLQRIKYRRKAVDYYLGIKNIDSAVSTISEIEQLLTELTTAGGTVQEFAEEIWEAEIDLLLKRGDLAILLGELGQAVQLWSQGYGSASSKPTSTEIRSHYLYELSSRLSNMNAPTLADDIASNFAISAIKLGGQGSSYGFLSNLPRLIQNATKFVRPGLMVEITQTLSSFSFFKVQAPMFYGRPGRVLTSLLEAAAKLIAVSTTDEKTPTKELVYWAELIDSVLSNYNRRLKMLQTKSYPQAFSAISRVMDALQSAGVDPLRYMHITVAGANSIRERNKGGELSQ
ncbi:hypothetical protein ALQ71_02962 [Pseudomonas coronafaciens pv. striafaciens]|uniref:KGGVGR-motif variant AAA ATPase n=1 Tax=Pseudomonas coronafaciens TaxID=53409 RepID=UPI000EFFE31D|nr:AAA family ATPase [Pseudomonas coronafaciens]RMM84577.1 hypothetical protein ALQ71_02962 [Pseudomonas coronafaciens pv. striafaciens]